jgi:hypothetical protein
MKKIVVFSVLLALLSAATFADDSGWAIGFAAQLSRNFFTAAKASGEYERTSKVTPESPTTDGTFTGKLGEYIKGSSHLWTWTSENPWNHDTSRPDNRLIVSLSNNGDHHSVYIDAKLDNGWVQGPTFMDLLNGGAADWSFSGDTGASGAAVVFDGKVGTGRYGGFVPAYEFWNDWIQSANYNFFGVMRTDDFVQSDNISVVNFVCSPWDAVYAVGATFGGNFRLAVGSTLYRETPSWATSGHRGIMRGFDDTKYDGDGNKAAFQNSVNNPYASLSRVRGAFMLSGRDLGPLAFDLFYGVNGGDDNTAIRGSSGKWENIIGVYIGLNIVENLGLSVGYTANFLKFETDQVNKETDPAKKPNYVPVETENPIWSGIDIKATFNGIDKIGITFNNNISFATVNGAGGQNVDDTVVNGLNYTQLKGGKITQDLGVYKQTTDYKTNTEGWTAWTAVLGVGLSLTDNLSVTLGVLNLLGINTTESDISISSDVPSSKTQTNYSKSTTTTDELRAAITASYGVGNVSFGLGLVFQSNWTVKESEVNSTNVGGLDSSKSTNKSTLNEFKFGVPIFFKVSI